MLRYQAALLPVHACPFSAVASVAALKRGIVGINDPPSAYGYLRRMLQSFISLRYYL